MEPVLLDFPFHGRWLTQNSPARRIPSHGTHRFGVTYAIDFVAVDSRGRSAPRMWRSLFSVEPPELFRGFGESVHAPAGGTVVIAHDGEPDHVAADRSWPSSRTHSPRPDAPGRDPRDRRKPRGGRPVPGGAVRRTGPPSPRLGLSPAGGPRRRRRPGRPVRQLRQQHRAARSRPGHRLHRLADCPRGAPGVPALRGWCQ